MCQYKYLFAGHNLPTHESHSPSKMGSPLSLHCARHSEELERVGAGSESGRPPLGQALRFHCLVRGQVPMKGLDGAGSWRTLEGLGAAGFTAEQYRGILML